MGRLAFGGRHQVADLEQDAKRVEFICCQLDFVGVDIRGDEAQEEFEI